MSKGVNKVIIMGNLGRDPEVRFTKSGTAVCNMRVAVTERRKNGDSWEDHTEWIDLVAWGKTAENCGQYLAKGRQLYAEGRLQTRKWQDKNGQDRYSTEVHCQSVLFLGGGRGDSAPAKDGDSFMDNDQLGF